MVTPISHTKTPKSLYLTAGPIVYMCSKPAQRSVHSSSTVYTQTSQRGLFDYVHIYCMRLLCYDSYTTDPDVMDQLGYCAYSYSALPLGIRFLIREDRLSLALLADTLLVPRPRLDYIL